MKINNKKYFEKHFSYWKMSKTINNQTYGINVWWDSKEPRHITAQRLYEARHWLKEYIKKASN